MLDFSNLGNGEIFFLFEFKNYLNNENLTLEQFLKDVKYSQQVRTTTKQSEYDIVSSEDLFELIYSQNIVPKNPDYSAQSESEGKLKAFLCLDKNYIDLLLLKKITKALAEIESNSELQ